MSLDRRSFFKSFALAVTGAVVAPSVFIPRAGDHHQWVSRKSGLLILNPEWVNAQYEVVFWAHMAEVSPGVFKRFGDPVPQSVRVAIGKQAGRIIDDLYSFRCNKPGDYPISPFIEV
jgi:hypothetical protein